MQGIASTINETGVATHVVPAQTVVGAQSAYQGYQIIRRNGAVVSFEPSKIAVALMKAFLAVHGTQGAASASVRETVDGLTDILTKFENPVAQPVATAVPAMAAVAAVGGPQPQQPALPVTHRDVTGLTTIAQKNQNWCWAAVSVMMRKL